MKGTIKKLVAKALEEVGDLEIVRAVNDPFPISRPEKTEPLKVSAFATLANRH